MKKIKGFGYPFEASIDPRDSSVWVVDKGKSEIIKISSAGRVLLKAKGFNGVNGLSNISGADGSFWVYTDGEEGKIEKVSEKGKRLLEKKGYGLARRIAVTP